MYEAMSTFDEWIISVGEGKHSRYYPTCRRGMAEFGDPWSGHVVKLTWVTRWLVPVSKSSILMWRTWNCDSVCIWHRLTSYLQQRAAPVTTYSCFRIWQ